MNFPFQRIALFCDSLAPSGVGRVMDTLARHLHRRGFFLFLICDEGEGADDLWHRARPFVCDGLRLRLRTPDDHQARAQLQAKLREWDIEVFHAHNGIAWEGHAGPAAAREAGVPLVVATEHLPAWKEWGDFLPWKRDALREVNALFAVSPGVRDSFVSLDLVPPLEPNAQAGRVEAVDNGVKEDEEQDKEEARRAVRCELGLPQGTPLLLFCGRLVEQKDPYALFDSFARLRSSGTLKPLLPAHLLVVGDGPLWEHCRSRVRENDLEARVHFLGKRGNVPRLMAASDCFVLPSKFEGLPLAVLEAMAARLPVVACDVIGTRECVRHEETGFLAPHADVEALTQGMKRALGEEGLGWAKAGRALFCQKFTGEAMTTRQLEAYERAWQARVEPMRPPSSSL
jgi:glycosyltransferase involved in cell wall biosynthesis